ncbi:response regulator transcription factor [Elstera cyanobacteriorum]|uniref:response regulator transcription factor n=1 Tax=Elstera cyanobacteriorum TaxID=2022747 RepID=UPI0023534265|nr:response regulator transcription factor [Elstera cyanobacteriorum]MCK6444179.1 response regulator transcription factor [Elstera cyanobacteriorum]
MRILLVEDERSIGDAVRDQLHADGQAVDWAESLAAAGEFLAVTDYDLLLLDLALPDGQGSDLLKRLRAAGSVLPVIILTAHDRISDRIAGLNAGADDYLVKPFDLNELSARIAAVARRAAGKPNPETRLGAVTLDPAARRASRDGQPVTLTAREWALLDALLRRPGAILSKPQLEESLYAFGDEVESNAVEAHVSRLRKKLGHEIVETARGLGYRLGSGT